MSQQVEDVLMTLQVHRILTRMIRSSALNESTGENVVVELTNCGDTEKDESC